MKATSWVAFVLISSMIISLCLWVCIAFNLHAED